jgi:hypothetical protein
VIIPLNWLTAFSSGISNTFFNRNLTEKKLPQHLKLEGLNVDVRNTFHYATHFHHFVTSIATNRPIHIHGVYEDRAQRLLWKYEYSNCDPISIIHLCNNHYVSLLPKSVLCLMSEKYTYLCKFLSAEDNNLFDNRPNYLIPNNEIAFAQDQSVVLIN